MNRPLILAIATLLLSPAAYAQQQTIGQTDDGAWQLSLYWDNDSSYWKPNAATDGQYSNGTGVSLTWENDFTLALAERAPFAQQFGPPDHASMGVIVGQQIYTPDQIDIDAPQPDDRPWAGYLFAGAWWQRSNEKTMDRFRLDVGVIGPSSQGDEVQRWVHDTFSAETPEGWDNQLADEPTAQLYLTKKWKLDALDRDGAPQRDRDTFGLELIPQAELALGTVHRYADAGLLVRTGWNMPEDFGPGQLTDPAGLAAAPTNGMSFYAFARFAGRAVEHDTFLDGNNYESSPGVEAEPLVGRMQFGSQVGYYQPDWSLHFTYSQTFLTRQFETEGGGHSYASFALAYTRVF